MLAASFAPMGWPCKRTSVQQSSSDGVLLLPCLALAQVVRKEPAAASSNGNGSGAPEPPAGSTPEEARAWIENWRSKQEGGTVAMSASRGAAEK